MAGASPSRRVRYERPVQRLPVRIFNAFAGGAERLGLRVARFSEESLLADARRWTGLCDFGDDSFREALRMLLRSLDEEARLHAFGRVFAHRHIVGLLANRLRMQEDWRRHPEILEEDVRRPLFVLGLPRTGTTLLQSLLASDPAHRWLAFWEAQEPSPPSDRAPRASDPRRRRAVRAVRLLDYLAPNLLAIHEFDAHGPQECFPLLSNAFVGAQFGFLFNVPGYGEWLSSQDMVPTYQYYRRQLQLLQGRCAAQRWVLKSPVHLFAIDAVLAVFPDACIVQCHRDPLEAIPSACSLVATMRGLSSSAVDPRAVGAQLVSGLAAGIERCMDARSRAGPQRFHDVRYVDLVRDPIGVVRGIYERFGDSLGPEAEEGLRACLARHPRDKRGAHDYSLGQFGLEREAVRRQFATYCEAFRIPAGRAPHRR